MLTREDYDKKPIVACGNARDRLLHWVASTNVAVRGYLGPMVDVPPLTLAAADLTLRSFNVRFAPDLIDFFCAAIDPPEKWWANRSTKVRRPKTERPKTESATIRP